MNIDNLRAFLEVSETGSFHKASENLFITQSSVSARIKSLEERVNRKLFTRKRHGVNLTASGLTFHKHALAVVKAWERAQQEVALPAGVENIVSLGLTLNCWHQISSSWMHWMAQHCQNTAIQIESDFSLPLISKVREGLLDIAILHEPQQSADVIIETYLQEQLILVSTTPRTVKERAAQGYVYIDWGQSFRDQHIRAYPNIARHKINIAIESIALKYILIHGGSGYFLYSTVNNLVKENKLYIVDDAPKFNITSYLVAAQERYKESHIQDAINGLKLIDHYLQHQSREL